MARCPKLDSESNSLFLASSSDKYVCGLTGMKLDMDDTKVKFVCNCDSGYE